MKDSLGKTKVMVNGGMTKDGMSKSTVDQCGICSMTVKANSVLCVQCSKWIHGRCAGIKITCRKCEGNIVGSVAGRKFCNDVESVRKFTYLGDMVSAGEGCEAAVTARTRCGWVKFKECGELLYQEISYTAERGCL